MRSFKLIEIVIELVGHHVGTNSIILAFINLPSCHMDVSPLPQLLNHCWSTLPCSVIDWLCVFICINSYQIVMICIDSVPAVIKQYQGDLYWLVFVFVICINSGSTCIDLYQSDLYHQSKNQQPSICSAGPWSRSPFLESSGNLFVLLYVDELYFFFTKFCFSLWLF